MAQQLRYCRESFRLTSRLMRIMVWLLVQRAVENRELTAEIACSNEMRLLRDRVYLDDEVVANGGLPPTIADLTARSRRLFVGSVRLDDILVRETDLPSTAGPTSDQIP